MNKAQNIQLGRIYKTIKSRDEFTEYIVPVYELPPIEGRHIKRYRYINVKTGNLQGWPMQEYEINHQYRLVDGYE